MPDADGTGRLLLLRMSKESKIVHATNAIHPLNSIPS